MPITYSFSPDSYSAIAGASFSEPRLENILLMDDYLQSATARISSKDIQNYLQATYSKDPSDLRSLISLMKKCGFIVIDNKKDFFASDYYSPKGEAFVHIVRAMSLAKGTSALTNIEDAFKLILQDAIAFIISNKKEGYENLKLLLELIIQTNTLSINEYLYGLSERLVTPGKNVSAIAAEILHNRSINAHYSYTNKASGASIKSSAIQASRELLQQAGLIKVDAYPYEIINKQNIINLI